MRWPDAQVFRPKPERVLYLLTRVVTGIYTIGLWLILCITTSNKKAHCYDIIC